MEQRYNIYFAGQLLEGHELSSVRPKLAKLFNANEQVLDKLFSGNSQLLKKDCDKATALKYKQAMEKAGARPVIKAATDAGSASQTSTTDKPATPAPEKKLTAAERIAALAAAADAGDSPQATQATSADPGTAQDGVALAPAGSDVLRPEERAPQISAEIDTGGLEIDAAAQRLSQEPPPAPPAPDTSHLDMGAVGEDIPTLASTEQPLSPNTDALDLSPAGTDFSDCAAPEPEQPLLDLSALDLAATGSDVLEEQYRKREQSVAPDTDHLSLGE